MQVIKILGDKETTRYYDTTAGSIAGSGIGRNAPSSEKETNDHHEI